MKKRKKTKIIACMLILILALAGCGSAGTAESSDAAETESSDTTETGGEETSSIAETDAKDEAGFENTSVSDEGDILLENEYCEIRYTGYGYNDGNECHEFYLEIENVSDETIIPQSLMACVNGVMTNGVSVHAYDPDTMEFLFDMEPTAGETVYGVVVVSDDTLENIGVSSIWKYHDKMGNLQRRI